MDYDIKLQHRKGSKIIATNTLSRCADWSTGIDQDNVDVVALPENLWIKLVDTELQDAVVEATRTDELAQEAILKVSDPSISPQHWTMESSGSDSSTRLLFYNGCLYIPDNPCSKTGLSAEKTSRLYIDNVFSRFGIPDKMISNRGPQFDSQFWKEFCNALQIRHVMSTAFHPQTNGGTEQVNREIQLYLSIFCINNPSSWASALKKAEFVYNNRPHADRSQSPFELWYGLSPKAIPEAFDYQDHPKAEDRLLLLNQWRNDALAAHEYT